MEKNELIEKSKTRHLIFNYIVTHSSFENPNIAKIEKMVTNTILEVHASEKQLKLISQVYVDLKYQGKYHGFAISS